MPIDLVIPAPGATLLPVRDSTAHYPVRRIYCVGRNYLQHVREMREADERAPPFFFQKPRDAIVADHGVVPYPPATEDLQYEVELVIAIGQRARFVSSADALTHVYGYAIGIDMTRRDRQRESLKAGLPWEIGKSFDASAPCGTVHPAEVIGHPSGGSITLEVNGQARQRGDLSELIWNVPEIVAKLSTLECLEPGDLIYTGTPAGVGPVVPGDRLVARIAGLGELRVEIGPRSS